MAIFSLQQVGMAMGAKYAPSLANLFMAEWENRHVFSRRLPQLRFYRRFIDDLLFIWEGPEESMVEFLGYLNTNTNQIGIPDKWQMCQYFLDVTTEKRGNLLNTCVYFKPTDRNSFLSIRSGHHPAWIKNIPKGQMLRVCRNCTEQDDYFLQANLLKERSLQKGFKENTLTEIIQQVANIPREQCLKKKRMCNT